VASVWLVACACAGALWSWLASDSCGSCSYARRLAGDLPVPQAGVALYALLLAAAFAPVPPFATSLAIGAAVGAHAALLTELRKAKVACWACIFVALFAAAAAIAILLAGAPLWPLVIGGVVAGAGTTVLIPPARERQTRLWRRTAEKLARDASAEPRPEGSVRLLAFTRKGCTSCAFFHAAVKPALLATFGDAITIDERELGSAQTVAPLLLVLGGRPTLFVGLPSGDSCERVLATVRDAVDAGGKSAEPMAIFQE
jgi:hypothetical protein